MREPPADLPTDLLRECLERDYGLTIVALTFLPLGHDSAAWVYRADAPGTSYFVKVRKTLSNQAALVVPHYLVGLGTSQVAAPVTTIPGALSSKAGPYVVIVFPYISDQTGLIHGMSDQQWVEYGKVLRQVHAAPITADLQKTLRAENFRPDGADAVRRLDGLIDGDDLADPGQATIANFWHGRRDTILHVLETAENLGVRLAASHPKLILCHADFHTNNVLVCGAEHVWIVDWDETMLAPRERDLMFVVGGIGSEFVDARREGLFFDGYGTVDMDPVALAYYRYAWAISDIGAYGEQVFLRPDLGLTDRSEAVGRFQSLFAPDSMVDIALNSVIPD